MWDLPGPGMSPALAGGLLTTEPPGKPDAKTFNVTLFKPDRWVVKWAQMSDRCMRLRVYKLSTQGNIQRIQVMPSLLTHLHFWQYFRNLTKNVVLSEYNRKSVSILTFLFPRVVSRQCSCVYPENTVNRALPCEAGQSGSSGESSLHRGSCVICPPGLNTVKKEDRAILCLTWQYPDLKAPGPPVHMVTLWQCWERHLSYPQGLQFLPIRQYFAQVDWLAITSPDCHSNFLQLFFFFNSHLTNEKAGCPEPRLLSERKRAASENASLQLRPPPLCCLPIASSFSHKVRTVSFWSPLFFKSLWWLCFSESGHLKL